MCLNYICQVEAAELESFIRTGKELGLQGLLENTTGAEVSGLIPVFENSKMFGDKNEETLSTELNKERSIISNLNPGSDSISIELPLDRSPEQDSKMVLDNTSEEALTIEHMNIELDEKPDDKILKECFDENLTKTNKKEDVEAEWKCLECSKSVCSEEKLKTHMANNHGVICKTCSFKTSSWALLGNHQKTVHGAYICDQCPFQTAKLVYLRRHKGIKHAGLRYQCVQCTSFFTEKRKLGNHMKFKHEGFRYECDQCNCTYTEKRKLVNHVRSKHGVAYQCEYCDHEANTDKLLKKHIRIMQKYNEEAHISV